MSSHSNNVIKTENKAHKPSWYKLAHKILSAENLRQVLSDLSDTEIARLVRTYVWAELPLFTAESELIEEVIDRLEERTTDE